MSEPGANFQQYQGNAPRPASEPQLAEQPNSLDVREPPGHNKLIGKLRLDRGPLRWWLLIAGILATRLDPIRFLVGLVLVVVGAVLRFVSKGYLRQGRRYLKQTQSITTAGPFRFTRHPFYLGNLIAEIGLLIVIGNLWIASTYLLVWCWVYRRTMSA